jgi:hypothetical protein
MTTETPGVTIHEAAPQAAPSVEPSALVRDGGPILSTATTRTGGTITADLTDGDLVTVQGVQMSVAQAVTVGALKRTSTGYEEIDFDAAQQQRAEAAAKHDTEELENRPALEVDAQTANVLTDISGSLESAGFNPVATLSAFLRAPDEIPADLMTIVRDRGYATDEVKTQLHQVAASIEESIADHVAKRGIPREEWMSFVDHAKRTAGPNTFTAAVIQAVYEQNLSGFDMLADAYVAGSAPKAPTKYETFTRQTINGPVEFVTINGQTLSVAAARKLGWLS